MGFNGNLLRIRSLAKIVSKKVDILYRGTPRGALGGVALLTGFERFNASVCNGLIAPKRPQDAPPEPKRDVSEDGTAGVAPEFSADSEEDLALEAALNASRVQEVVWLFETAFDELEWPREFNDELDRFCGTFGVNGKLGVVRLYIWAKNDGAYAVAAANFKVVKERRRDVAEFLTRINCDLTRGRFDFDMRDGEFHYREFWSTADLLDDSSQAVAQIFARTRRAFEKYADAILSVALGFASAAEAFEKVKNVEEK